MWHYVQRILADLPLGPPPTLQLGRGQRQLLVRAFVGEHRARNLGVMLALPLAGEQLRPYGRENICTLIAALKLPNLWATADVAAAGVGLQFDMQDTITTKLDSEVQLSLTGVKDDARWAQLARHDPEGHDVHPRSEEAQRACKPHC